MNVRIFLALASAAVTIAAGLGFTSQLKRADHLASEVAKQEACVASVEGRKGAKPAAQVCAKPIAEADRLADQALQCEAELKANVTKADGKEVTATNGVGVMAACLPQVQRLFGQSLANASTILDLRGQIAVVERDRNSAVARAEARGRALAKRDLHAQAVRESAPLDSDGLRAYDAERLRQRFEADPPVAP
ncbi:hypothetical protein [Phenylobacterium sp.]|uniref:hypothetical protein n=1 Tax=Phenylobacterium sp. TaxID=1871053 RepID=UPI0035B25C6A